LSSISLFSSLPITACDALPASASRLLWRVWEAEAGSCAAHRRVGRAEAAIARSTSGRAPGNAEDQHRKLTEADDLSEVLAWREERTVTKNLTCVTTA
jgi:hypothetical protein